MISERLLARARAALVALRRPVRGMAATPNWFPLADLRLFARVPLWTARQHADYTSGDRPAGAPLVAPDADWIRTTRRDLQRLQRHGVLGRIQGARTGGGGSEEDTYFRTKLGALVLDLAAGDEPGTLPTRRWVLDAGHAGADGLVTHRAAAFLDPHQLAIYEIARHCRLADADDWQIELPLPYRIPYGGGAMRLIPDLAFRGARGWCCLEVEGTPQREHIEIVQAQMTKADVLAA